jgi:hypothetical protein
VLHAALVKNTYTCLLANGYEWSIATVVLYIDIHLTAIDEIFGQFEIIVPLN